MVEQQCEGVCKWFNATKGYGWIDAGDGGGDVFCHFSEIRMEGYRSLSDGQRVSFTLTETPRGRAAVDVKPL